MENSQRVRQTSKLFKPDYYTYYDSSREVVGTIPDQAIALFFNLRYPSSHTMALELTQPLTEMSISILPE
jgi:hypothetical protein